MDVGSRLVFTLATLAAVLAWGLSAVGCKTSASGGGDAGAAVDEDSGVVVCPTLPSPLAFVPGSTKLAMDDTLRLNHLQAKGTHNSYHVRPASTLVDWQYSHKPLAEQLDAEGVRAVELDVQWDDACQRFLVYHIGTLDDRSTCRVFTDCLVAIRGWSAAHPGHHAIFVQIEPKWNSDPAVDEAHMLALEKEILAVFARPWLVTPDDVKGTSASLAKGIAEHGWPTLGESRGRVLFFLNDGGGIRDAYSRRRTSLDGRLLFAEASVGDPTAGVMVLNDPAGDGDAIQKALAAGYIVRTRADELPSTLESTDRSHRDLALAGGAQIVTTDFPVPVEGVPYSLEIPGGTPSRCSPVTAPAACAPLLLEDPAKLAR